jgi:hypothetical protein
MTKRVVIYPEAPRWRYWSDHFGNRYYWSLNKPDGKYWGKIYSIKKNNYGKMIKYNTKKTVKSRLVKALRKQNARYYRAENKRTDRYYAKKQKAVELRADEGYQSDLRVKKYKESVITSEKAIKKYSTKIKLSNTMIKKHIKNIKQLQKKILKELGDLE